MTTKGTADQPKPFLEHLADLRTTLLGCLAAWGVGMAIVMPFAPRLFTLLRAPLTKITEHPEQFLRSLEITGGFPLPCRSCSGAACW